MTAAPHSQDAPSNAPPHDSGKQNDAGRRARFLRALFGFDCPETPVERKAFVALELFLVAFLLFHAWTWAAEIQTLATVVRPAGLGYYVDVSVFFESWAAYAVAGGVTAAFVLAYTRGWRYGYLAGLVLLHLLFVARHSQGKLPHGTNTIALVLLGLGLAVVAFDDEQRRRRFTTGFAFFFLGVGYVSAAVSKLIGTGLHWVDGHHLQLWISQKSVDVLAQTGAFAPNVIQGLLLDHYWMATALLTVGLLTEALAFLLWWPRFRLPLLLALAGMHAGVYVTMNITFLETGLLLLLLAAAPAARFVQTGRLRPAARAASAGA
jgi:hypothetical protein